MRLTTAAPLFTVLLGAIDALAAPTNCTPTCYPAEPAGQKGPCNESMVACEPAGSKAVRAINMIHYRVDEAQKAKAAGKKDVCQSAAQVAAALSQGLPKFRQQLQASGNWSGGVVYKTRYDGKLNEAALFSKVDEYGKQARDLYTACGGKGLRISSAEEMAFKEGAPAVQVSTAVDLTNKDGVEHPWSLKCPDGSTSNGTISNNTQDRLGSDLKGCTLKIEGGGSAKIRGAKGGVCEIEGGQVTCE